LRSFATGWLQNREFSLLPQDCDKPRAHRARLGVTYANYAIAITNALRGAAINFYNPADYALDAWQINEGFCLLSESNGYVTMKPNTFFGYSCNPTTLVAQVTTNEMQIELGITNVQTRVVTNLLELMPFVARPLSLAVGAQDGVGGSIHGSQFNLENQLNFTGAEYDHSGEFNRNIQEPQVNLFYLHLLNGLLKGQP
jgi:hypothetical protein